MKRRSRAEEIFNEIVNTVKDAQKDIEGTVNQYTNANKILAMDVVEEGKDIMVITDLPGVVRDNIKIDLTEDTLEITAQFNELSEGNFVRKERLYGKANRIVSLPAKIKINESSAKFENGVLTVVLPKLENTESFEVKVD
ncbi:MAG: Hsp20/alpha crystallin family protein [Methanobacterium sp.]